MKKRNIATTLILALTLGIGATAYAATENANTSNTTTATNTRQPVGLNRAIGVRGYEFMESVLKDLGKLTDEEISKARLEGKTLYDIATEKGLSYDDLKNAMLNSKYKAIDDAVTKGTITSEQAATYKNAIKSNSENAVPGQGRINGRRGTSAGQGSQGTGAGRGYGRMNSSNCLYVK
ncbi:hypothetical protein CLHOM_01520 [Clostridium homopropionicum DSM 5847]|uniref:Uncharacterized protein n=1 Tax=Clostridium homopropionicum DSM 5847 TaxID=1121318 RepID=A0A0L6ZET0_9CLOT|nr:hypothetical protein [Clostridium homopropionicum]KOA21481.1 hypothetical protein CLHOM_01520 [Clostridium homopropionicum DSM 5847]SFG08325.1 hypothetical protein SAMN04488501_10569 [Clostridium homopropionicum]